MNGEQCTANILRELFQQLLSSRYIGYGDPNSLGNLSDQFLPLQNIMDLRVI